MNRKTVFYSLGAVFAVGVVAFGTWCALYRVASCQAAVSTKTVAIDQWPDLLKLDSKQRREIEPMLGDLKKEMNQIEAELATGHISLCQLMMMPETTDQKSAESLMNQMAELRKRKDQKMVEHLFAIRGLLNSDQQKTLFMTMMQDICVQCRAATGDHKDRCGFCKTS